MKMLTNRILTLFKLAINLNGVNRIRTNRSNPCIRFLYLVHFVTFFLISPTFLHSQDISQVLELRDPVEDKIGLLSNESKQEIRNIIYTLQKDKGSQIQVLIVNTTEPEAIEQFSMRYAEAWKIGRKGVDDGVILVIAKEDRKLRIEVGYGLEGAIPDVTARRIINDYITPHFKEGNFDKGVLEGVKVLDGLIRGELSDLGSEANPNYDTSDVSSWSTIQSVLVVIGLVIAFILIVMGRYLTAFVVIFIFFGIGSLFSEMKRADIPFETLTFSVIAWIFLTAIRHGGGGSGSSGGWSSSGGGGWSGGGGSFGGGGSSGSW
ncbi:TPM domain-containing protein [Leptospira sp. GIMC2001]|uniref:TPM domain-containing protein n=1 Tax=Leptospira sp. GIMC2001 TaxID=1513297 RepID=UPI0023498D59|nr:TPM domain-containing protein [Leptospira sp. GIMC2001]WCL49487.1 TPM domain-containing protein [Leptospira sp. GIMC2001]